MSEYVIVLHNGDKTPIEQDDLAGVREYVEKWHYLAAVKSITMPMHDAFKLIAAAGGDLAYFDSGYMTYLPGDTRIARDDNPATATVWPGEIPPGSPFCHFSEEHYKRGVPHSGTADYGLGPIPCCGECRTEWEVSTSGETGAEAGA